MSVFNSLGSNYTPRFAMRSLIAVGSRSDTKPLRKLLQERYSGEVELTYKGRQALREAVMALQLPAGSKVAINGFTCYVVWQAVVDAGCTPVFIDVAPGSLHFDAQGLQDCYKKHRDLKAVIIQNSLGIACDIQGVEKQCKQRSLALVEDLAHSMGVRYADDREAGTVGDTVMLSFSQDKPLDAVAGGAVIYRKGLIGDLKLKPMVDWRQRFINRIYPLASSSIRLWYSVRLGAVLHAGLKSINLMATPMSGNSKKTLRMSPLAVRLVLSEWSAQKSVIKHRRAITAIYQAALPAKVRLSMQKDEACLRYPLFVDDPKSLIAYLRQIGVYVGDTWYDAPIGPKRYMEKTDYRAGMCPNAEYAAAHIVNLPTHVHVSESDAKRIVERVNQWLKSQHEQ